MGGCASKPKDLGTRKLPSPAVRKPHAPPEVPVQSPEAAAAETEKKDGDENKETTTLVDVCESAQKMKEPETSEAKPVNGEGVAVKVKPTEAKVEAPKEEKKEVAETAVPNKEEKEATETVVVKEVAGIEAPKEKKEEAETQVVPKKEKKEEVAEKVVPKQKQEKEV